MLEKGKITSVAVFFSLMNVIGATAVVALPGTAARFAGRDAWLVPIVSSISGLVVILLVTELGRRFPGKTLIEYTQEILGSWVGKVIGALYMIFFILISSVIIREFGELFATTLMPHTPILIFHISIVLLAAYSIRSGLEVIGRLSELILPWVIILYVTVILFSLQTADFQRLLPVLENGFSPVLLGSVVTFGWWGEVVVLAMLLPYLAVPRKGKTIGVWSVLLLSFILIFDAVINTALFGPEAARTVFPSFMILSEVLVGGFLRIDAVFVIFWMSGILVKLAIFYYAAVLGTAQLLNLSDYRPVVLPIGVIQTAFSILLFKNSVEIDALRIEAFPVSLYFFEWLLPLALLLIAIIRGFKPRT
jgi:spore germination protein KB